MQSSASLFFVRGIHQWPVNSPHKWPVTRKMFPFDDVIMCEENPCGTAPHQILVWLSHTGVFNALCFCLFSIVTAVPAWWREWRGYGKPCYGVFEHFYACRENIWRWVWISIEITQLLFATEFHLYIEVIQNIFQSYAKGHFVVSITHRNILWLVFKKNYINFSRGVIWSLTSW